MRRYIYIPFLISILSCFASASTYSTYTYDSLPMPEINYLSSPYEQIRDVNEFASFDGRPSFDPGGGRIIEWKWNFYKYNGKGWDFIFTLSGPDKAAVRCKFPIVGYYKAQLWVRASDVSGTGHWNSPVDVKEIFVYTIIRDISCDKYIAVGSGVTFTYLIVLPKDIQVKEAYLTMLDEYGLVFAEICIKNPVIGKKTKFEWDGKANKGPNAGQSIPAGQFRVNFRVVPFHGPPEKPKFETDLKNVA